MPIFERGDIVRVPFPYTDRDTRQRRPALVVSSAIGEGAALLWVVMITSAENRRWADDIPILDHASAGLPAPSVVRPVKIATVEARHVEAIGKLPDEISRSVIRRIAGILSTALNAEM
ncbi:Transcriptional modulator of MazE/toxin, MazF [Neorhizobium galegae bv. officinalis bv. officinalis str. HAMBI 1141]|uniref:Transcriptional modulator of MazE/toxin, MazF n=1 Tax=Neorhizobium galegae bv. officinalis bv. officinalis str. HAMBI 1141 TaxID=1028801 RepID=A0A068T593_NEOGA|nr:type II toxin-antitoxin system PemK/MazF family toxin [Neorhizobium galegae]CDN53658.1 Transcriptional modulator of MazE/toxin, MazF [Neorhizobium galegae bv. officinalis bv. officinalis str. HAMBI 1141]